LWDDARLRNGNGKTGQSLSKVGKSVGSRDKYRLVVHRDRYRWLTVVIGGTIGIRRADRGRGCGNIIIMSDTIGISHMGRGSGGRGGRHRRVVPKWEWSLKR
jgi:hypothetical protein